MSQALDPGPPEMIKRSRPPATAVAPADAAGSIEWLWVLDELRLVWRKAQLEAAAAYLHWRRTRDRAGYAVYRAAQDRADAAQDALSRHEVRSDLNVPSASNVRRGRFAPDCG